MNTLYVQYENISRKDLIHRFNYNKFNNVPKLNYVVINISVKQAVLSKKSLIPVLWALELITGKKATITRAHKAIANFKLKKNMPIGCKVLLTDADMYIFLNKLKNIVLPNIREFSGISIKSFDGKGNYAIGINDFSLFSEISFVYEKMEMMIGMNINFITSSSNKEAKVLLSGFQLPF